MTTTTGKLAELTGQRLGPYQVGSPVGAEERGVFLARAEGADVDVRLFVADGDDLENGQVDLFLRDAPKLTSLSHPTIAPALDSGTDNGILYLAQEVPKGETLPLDGSLSVEMALNVARQALDAFRFAHQNGVEHGGFDVESIFLQDQNRVVISGFGAPRPHWVRVVRGNARWSPDVRYAAPEQIVGEPVIQAADLYALGVAMFGLLTGRLPFTGHNTPALIYQHLEEAPESICKLNASIPRPLEAFVFRLLEKLPEDRPTSALEALAKLEEVARHHRLTVATRRGDSESPPEDLEERDFVSRLVGRESELHQLREARSDNPATVTILSGEAGVGKTRLVRDFALGLEEAGTRVVWGRCPFEEGHSSYGPFLEILGNLTSPDSDSDTTPPGGIDAEAATKWRAHFAELFGGVEDGAVARVRFFDAILDEMKARAQGDLLLVVLEDVHWIDTGSAELVRHLARGLVDTGLSLLLTYRPEESDTAVLTSLLQDLETEHQPLQLRVGRLDSSQTQALADSLFPSADFSVDFLEYLFSQSLGNPLVAVEVLRLLYSQGIVHEKEGLWTVRPDLKGEGGVPDRVRSLVSRRIEELVRDDRELLQAAAVIGQSFTAKQLQNTLGVPRMQLMTALFRLEKRCRLITGREGGAYEFAHPKIREVLYEQLPWELRREYHQAIATMVGAGDDTVDHAVLGHHLYGAEQYEESVPHLRIAAEQSAQLYDWRAAARLYDLAIEAHRVSTAEKQLLLELNREAGLVYYHLGANETARERFVAMRDLATSVDSAAHEAAAWHYLSRTEKRLKNFAAAVSACERCIGIVSEHIVGGDAVMRARSLTTWGTVDFEWGRYDQAEARWQEALDTLQDDRSAEAANVFNNLAALSTVRGEFDRALELYQRVLEIDEKGAVSNLAVLTYSNMGMLRADQERWDDALELYERSLALCRQTRDSTHEPEVHLNCAEALIGKGRPEAATESLAQAQRGFRRLGDALGEADALKLTGRLRREAGDIAEARSSLERSIAINREFGGTVSLAEALYEMGLVLHDADEAAEAGTALVEAQGIFEEAGAKPDLEKVSEALERL